MARCELAFCVVMIAFVQIAFPVWAQETDGRAPPGERLTILFTSDLRGGLIAPGCGRSTQRRPLLPRVSAAVAQERTRAARTGEPEPLLFDAGDALFPSPMIRDLASDPTTARTVISSLRSAGYNALATGNTTISAPQPAMLGILRAAAEEGLPFLATNLRCEQEDVDEGDEDDEDAEDDGAEERLTREERCEQSIASLTDRSALIRRGTLKIGVFSVLPEDLAERVSRENVTGAELSEPQAATRETVRALRDRGADLVILLSHLDRSETAPRRTLEHLARLTPEEAPDLVIAANTAGLAIRIRTALGGPIVLAVAGDSLGRARLERSNGRWSLREASEVDDDGQSDEILHRIIESWRTTYCEQQGRFIAGGELAGTMESEDFLHLALRVMREQTRSDFAIINNAAIADRRLFPLEGPLTQGHIRRAFPYDNDLRVAMVRGSDASSIASHLLEADETVVVGIEERDGAHRINGREIDPDAWYRFVTIDFIAEGGDGILDPATESLEYEAAEESEQGDRFLAERIVSWLGVRGGEVPYDPVERRDLYLLPNWAGSARVEANISNLSVDADDSDYDQPQLDRDNIIDIELGVELIGGVSTRDHSWENRLLLRYGQQRIDQEPVEGEDGESVEVDPWTESNDLIQFRSTYDFDLVRNRVLDGAWYGPSFFLEYLLESEFSPEDEREHFLEMTGAVGLLLKPFDWLRFSVGPAVRSVLLADDASPSPGLTLRAELSRRHLLGNDSAPIFITMLVDYFVLWPDEGASHKLSAEGIVEVELFGPLALAMALRVFLYDESWDDEAGADPDVATAIEGTLGIRVVLNSRAQMY